MGPARLAGLITGPHYQWGSQTSSNYGLAIGNNAPPDWSGQVVMCKGTWVRVQWVRVEVATLNPWPNPDPHHRLGLPAQVQSFKIHTLGKFK